MTKTAPQTDGHAIGGFDPVAYFEQGEAVRGDPSHTVTHAGATWLFSSRTHAQTFEASPSRYEPAYLGHCAFATGLGKSEVGKPQHWAIRGGRLFLNSNAVAHLLWKVLPGRIAAADRKWQGG
jgi:hypothetical protein